MIRVVRWCLMLPIRCSSPVARAPAPGQRQFVPVLARSAVAAGIAGLFMETHPDPDKALSDGPNSWPLKRIEELLGTLKAIDDAVKSRGFACDP